MRPRGPVAHLPATAAQPFLRPRAAQQDDQVWPPAQARRPPQ